MNSLSLVLFLLLVPLMAVAQQDPMTRRDGFLMIWDSLLRPAEFTRKASYTDIQEGSEGYTEIIYAKRRGLLNEDEAAFYPNDALTLEDALKWLFRTRNVREWDTMNIEDLPELLQKYPIASIDALHTGVLVSESDLQQLIDSLDQKLIEEVHEVSFYAEDFHGKGTAFGETFDMHAMTAAHRTLPHNTALKVTNVENGQWVLVRINDRGPYIEGRDLDLSLGSFLRLSQRSRGKLHATFERLGDARLIGWDENNVSEDPEVTDVSEKTETIEVVEESENIEEVDSVAPSQSTCGEFGNRYQKRITRDVRFKTGIPHVFALGESLVLQANRIVVIHKVTLPDGSLENQPHWIDPGQRFAFNPKKVGEYVFLVGTGEGRKRTMTMRVDECS